VNGDARICELHRIVGEVDRVTALLADVTAMVDRAVAQGAPEGRSERLVVAHAGIRTMQRRIEGDRPALVALLCAAHGLGPRD
jgi:hypothetical protein